MVKGEKRVRLFSATCLRAPTNPCQGHSASPRITERNPKLEKSEELFCDAPQEVSWIMAGLFCDLFFFLFFFSKLV